MKEHKVGVLSGLGRESFHKVERTLLLKENAGLTKLFLNLLDTSETGLSLILLIVFCMCESHGSDNLQTSF